MFSGGSMFWCLKGACELLQGFRRVASEVCSVCLRFVDTYQSFTSTSFDQTPNPKP